MPTLRLKHKLLALVLIMGLVPFAGALFIHTAHDEQVREDARALRVQQGLADVEKINQLVYAVVAESRGIYLAQSWEEARPFAEALLSFLKEIDARTAGLAAVSDGDQALIDETRRTAAIFIRMRQDLVASARDVSLSVGRTIGDTARLKPEKETAGLSEAPLASTVNSAPVATVDADFATVLLFRTFRSKGYHGALIAL